MTETASLPNELPALGFLTEISEEHRSFLACFGKYHRPYSGDAMIAEGEAQDSLYIILTGKLHIVAGATTGQSILLAALGPGDSMGEINLFDPGTASASVIVRGNALVWSLSRSELDAFLEADPIIGNLVLRALLGQLSKRIRAMNDKLITAERKSELHYFWSNNLSELDPTKRSTGSIFGARGFSRIGALPAPGRLPCSAESALNRRWHIRVAGWFRYAFVHPRGVQASRLCPFHPALAD